MSDVPAPAPESAPRRRRHSLRYHASEWGLRLLALILAVLVYMLVLRNINADLLVKPLGLRPEPRNADQFIAFHVPQPNEELWLLLKGARGKVEEQRRVLGDPPRVVVTVGDLADGVNEATITYTFTKDKESIVPRRLVAEMSDFRLRVFRRTEQVAKIALPEIAPQRPGLETRITLSHEVVKVTAPYQQLGDVIQPDPIDLSGFGSQIQAGTPIQIPLTFNAWRSPSPEVARYRSVIALPPDISATVTFVATEKREIDNRLQILYTGQLDVLDGGLPPHQRFVATIEATSLREVGGESFFTGAFVGGASALDQLAAAKGEWHYGLAVPLDQLTGLLLNEPEPEKMLSLPLRWYASTETLRSLAVEFVTEQHVWVRVRLRN